MNDWTTPPTPPTPTPEPTRVSLTADFLRPFASARFMLDHLALPNDAAVYPYVATKPGGPAAWGLRGKDGAAPVYRVSLDAFRTLQAADLTPEGGFVLRADVRLASGEIIPKGTRGWLHLDGASAVIATTDKTLRREAAPQPAPSATVPPEHALAEHAQATNADTAPPSAPAAHV